MLKKLYQRAFGREYEIEERLFRMILLVAGAALLLAVVESFFLMNLGLAIPLLVFFLIIAFVFFATFKHCRVDFAAVLVGLLFIVGLFPGMFFVSGGILSGAVVWFALELVYIFIMFSGRKLAFFLTLSVLVDFAVYGLAYHFPQIVTPIESKTGVYLDSLFSVLAVGLAVGWILKFQIKMLEEERTITLSQKEELEKVSNSKNAFFVNMSHEIRTPINTIIGSNDMIIRENPSDEIKEYAGNIQSAGSMLLSLVNDILDLSQMEMKRIEIVPAEYETRRLFEELVDMVRVLLKEKNLDFRVKVDTNLPSVLCGDEKRIKQIILNLLSNAVKYTNEGSVTLSAGIEAQTDGKIKIKVRVKDTGVGIRKEDVKYLYDAFRRVDEKRNMRVEGSGLGLSITKQLVDLMQGEISVDSVYAKGTIFTVLLEQEVVDDRPVGEVDFFRKDIFQNGYRYQQSFEASEARILIVDDNEMNAVVESRLLRDTKMQVDIAGSGEECLKMTKQKYYHVILMDYWMPGLNGEQTFKELRRQENGLCRDSSVIVLSANTSADNRRLCEKYGFDGYLEKPLTGEKLEAEILKFLPEDIVEYRMDTPESAYGEGKAKTVTHHKRKKIYVTSDCVCDIPEELLEKYDIKLMYLYIKTDSGRFMDKREIDCDNLKQYISTDSAAAYVDNVTAEEYEDFFAESLIRAEHVLHISMADCIGKNYQLAQAAAKGFDHVTVVDSGQISAGQGLIVLYAAKMAMEGYSVAEIAENIAKIRENIETKFMMPTAKIFYRNGYTNKIMAKACDMFQLHPVVSMRKNGLMVIGAQRGSLENAWKRYIRRHLTPKRKVNTDVVLITHVGCSVRQLEYIRDEILKCVPFEKVFIQKASFTVACNAGLEAVGVAYYRKNN